MAFKIFERKRVGGLLYYAYRVDNLIGHRGKDGRRLSMELDRHLEQMGAEVVHDDVTSVEKTDDGFLVNDEAFSHVILATGSTPRRLDIPGVQYFIEEPSAMKGKELLIIGGGDLAYDNGLRARRKGANVTILTRDAPRANRSLLEEARNNGIVELTGSPDDLVPEGRVYRYGSRIFDVVAVFIGRDMNRELVKDMGSLEVNLPDFSTSIKGLYIVGDAALGTLSQTALASGSGIAAAMHIAKTVRER